MAIQQEDEVIRTLPGAVGALAIAAAVAAVALLSQYGGVEAQSHSATRSFDSDWSAPGAELQVSIATSDLGGFGQVVETLPAGFTYVRTGLDDFQVEVEGQTVSFTLLGDQSFTYVVTVPSAEGAYTFSGVVKNADREERTVSGETMLRVGPPPTPEPTATPEPAPTAAPEPVPTATPELAPTATSELVPTATPEPTPTTTTVPTPTTTTVPTPTTTAQTEPTAIPRPEPTATTEPEPTARPRPEPTAILEPEPSATTEPQSIVVAPTAAPTPTATALVETGTPGGSSGVPVLLWTIVAVGGIGAILAVFLYIRSRNWLRGWPGNR